MRATRSPRRSTRFSLATERAILAAGLAVALTLPALAQDAPSRTLDSSSFLPIQSPGRTVEAIVRDIAGRRQSIETVMAASASGAKAAASQPAGSGSSAASSLDRAGADAAYDWALLQTWLPDENGVQWCVDGSQTVQPVGGVRLYVLSQAYTGLQSLQPSSLVVTLDAQEQIPDQHPNNRSKGPTMPHEFTYSACVLPEFTRVGTYSTVAYSCGSEQECADSPRVSPMLLNLKPFLSTFDVCVDREAGEVDIFQSALYFDQRPNAATFRLRLDGKTVPTTKVQTEWPWVMVDFTMPLADYDDRFGSNGDFAKVALFSDSPFTPRARLFFSKSDWLSPCIQ